MEEEKLKKKPIFGSNTTKLVLNCKSNITYTGYG